MEETESTDRRRRIRRIERRFQQQGLLLRKRRETRATRLLPGGFMIVDAATKGILAGAGLPLSLDEVEAWGDERSPGPSAHPRERYASSVQQS
jgi:hypothetical protein